MSDELNATGSVATDPKANTAPQQIEVEIARDWWDNDCVRHPAGTVVSVPIEAALEGIEKGSLRRVRKDAQN